MSLDMPITFMGSNGDGPRKLLAVDNIVIRTMRNDSIALGMEPETDLREASLKCKHLNSTQEFENVADVLNG